MGIDKRPKLTNYRVVIKTPTVPRDNSHDDIRGYIGPTAEPIVVCKFIYLCIVMVLRVSLLCC